MPNSGGSTIIERHHTEGLTFETATDQDGAKMWQLVQNSGVLDVNSPYSYLMMCKFHQETCIVAKDKGELIGFVTAFLPQNDSNVVFVWQIGVSAKARGKGIGSKLLKALLKTEICQEVSFLETTISPSNLASQSLFKKLARDLNTNYHISECFSESLFPGDEHEKEDTYRIGPF